MTPEDAKKTIDRAVAKYGPNFEVFLHGPGSEGSFLSGFGPECNSYMGEITLGDGRKVKALFMHGLPIQFDGEVGLRFPVLTGAFPLHSRKIKSSEGDF